MRSKMSSILKAYIIPALLWLACMGSINHTHAQLIGTEQSVSKTVFRGDFTVAGDKDPAAARLHRVVWRIDF
jgi:hypothetical protein